MKKILAAALSFPAAVLAFQISITGPNKAYHIGQFHSEIVIQTNLTNAFLNGITHTLPVDFKFDFTSNLTLAQTNALYLALSNHTVAPATANVPYALAVSGTDNFVNSVSLGTFYRMANGAWRMRFSISGSSDTDTHVVITVSNITFSTAFTNGQAIVLTTKHTTKTTQAWANPGVSTIEGVATDLLGVGSGVWSFSGDVALQSKPSYLP